MHITRFYVFLTVKDNCCPMSAERQSAQGTQGPRKEFINGKLQACQYVLLSLWLLPVITNFSTLKVFSSFPIQSHAKSSPSLHGEGSKLCSTGQCIFDQVFRRFSGKDTKAERHRTISRILQQLAAAHLQFELQNCYLHDKVLQSVTYKRTDHQKLGMKV